MNSTFKNVGNNIISFRLRKIVELLQIENLNFFADKTIKTYFLLFLGIHLGPLTLCVYTREAGIVVTIKFNLEINSLVKFPLTLWALRIHILIIL